MVSKKVRKRVVMDNLRLFSMMLPALIVIGIFNYWPMFGIVLAFKDYKVPLGIFGSPWVDPIFKNIEFFLKSQDAWRVTRNTIGLNVLFIFAGHSAAIIFALVMFEVKKAFHVKVYQTISILPSFLSWVVVSYMVYALLDPKKGILNQLIEMLGGEGISWYTEPKYWPVILLITIIWRGTGLSSIMYYAALMGVDMELYEAADIDGASKLQKTWYVSIPQIVPIITIMVILDFGKIFRSDFGLFYNVTRDMGALYPTTDVIDTYVFRALMDLGDTGMSSAVGVFQSVICMIMLLIVNGIAKKIDPERALF